MTNQLPHLITEMKLIESAMGRNFPVLGICLGAQLIAKTLGAAVYSNKEKEIGWYDVSPTDEAEKDPLLLSSKEQRKFFSGTEIRSTSPKALSSGLFFPVRQSGLSLWRECLWPSVSSGSRRADDPSVAPGRRKQERNHCSRREDRSRAHSPGNPESHEKTPTAERACFRRIHPALQRSERQ